jgi:hypothetical protein
MPICEGEEAVMIPLAIPTPNHFQRDTILGAGASDNTLIAQPFSYPVFGRYEGGGDVATGEKELGKTSLCTSLQVHAMLGNLVAIKGGAPTPVGEAVDKETLYQHFVRGELLLTVKNRRKEWLRHLRKTIDMQPADARSGFAHYAPQLAVDVQALPEFEFTGLGMMLVSRPLYAALIAAEGQTTSDGYWEGEEFVPESCTAREELTRYAQKQESVPAARARNSEGYVAELMRSNFYPQNEMLGFLVLEEAQKGSEIARELWVSFMLFAAAMSGLRKQWSPQAGAGRSSGLYETEHLYSVVHQHMDKQLHAYAG